MPIQNAFIMPHPPVIMPEVGRGRQKEIQSTIDACHRIAQRIAELRPETIVLVSPHSVMYADYFHISPGTSVSGDMGRFGAPQAAFSAEYDSDYVNALTKRAQEAGLSAGTEGERDPSLDHGSMIPLYFVNQYYTEYTLVRIGLSGLPLTDHYKLGMCIAETADRLGKNAVLLASGDLSHRLTRDGPYGYAEEGPLFDKEVTSAMEQGDFGRFLTFEPSFLENAAECGLRSFVILSGVLDKKAVAAELHAYEGPFGVGYAVAAFSANGADDRRDFLTRFLQERAEARKAEDAFVKLARYTLEHFVRTGRMAEPPDDLPTELTDSAAGVFVSLKKYGELRGCIGTIRPVTESIAMEIMRNAVCSGTEDPRFDPVGAGELDELSYSVDVLSPAEPIDSEEMLDVKRYGIIVTSGHRRGLLLPNLDGVDTVEQQLDIAKRKAGIAPHAPCTLERFEVVRHK